MPASATGHGSIGRRAAGTMRILFLGINYWPEETGIAVFNTGRCEYLASRGHEVTMVTGLPYYPQWRIAEEYQGKGFLSEGRNGVQILRCPLYVPERVDARKRILHEASFVASATFRALGARKPQVLYLVSPPLALGMAARLLSLAWRVPYLFHVADLQPDAARDLGMLREGPFLRLLFGLEKAAYSGAGRVATLTEGMRRRILEKGFPPEKVLLLPDWADPSLFAIPLEIERGEFCEERGWENRFLVVHSGNMGVKQGLEVVLEAARETAGNLEILYLLVGDGAARPALEARARAMGLKNLVFLPLLPREEFHRLLAASDLCLVTQKREVGDIVFPSKVMTLLAAGRPLVVSVSPGSEVARVAEEAEAGVSVPPEDGKSLAEAVFDLWRDPDRRRRMGTAGRRYAEARWSREAALSRMERAIEELRRPDGLDRLARA
ncbi:Alpha-D-kanosaminyltransferase [Methylacidimicrobium cyclopophantes]|uniref:Alpha-D-kanosaminyltransferase n=1 Tax=Methylacidimicrobium cyclopophantes TaxID=1041766 RepID=A0A5E6MQF1_9BACT|nr:WcaI family glycosyltransferase [Methylacidimicrobium cyclopophantes]VVM07824.1 Alpha-D-kanosaminyltransferase [Methylacidimicrobium cyclopophantes]